jgi:cytoskeletal protein CcmA (bactofilin family)
MLFNSYGESRSGSVNPLPSEQPPVAARKATAPTRSVIDSWLTITGNLQSEGEVQVEGQINGDIRCAHLTVGRDASITGNIIAEEVVVRGKVKGIIRANRVTLQDGAQVESEIYHKSLVIEQGGLFDGTSRRREDPMQSGVIELKSAAA